MPTKYSKLYQTKKKFMSIFLHIFFMCYVYLIEIFYLKKIVQLIIIFDHNNIHYINFKHVSILNKYIEIIKKLIISIFIEQK